jgi:predicted Ser/Thr protein kinase
MAQITPLRPDDPSALGSYRLAGRLGEGGQGVVYAAHAADGTPVALKVLREEWAAETHVRDRFAKEVAAARRVAPFCVAQVLDADLTISPPYIVTEFVDGPTLLEAVRDGGPRSGPALHRLAVATATALAAIHEAGVVHRDFKPANVLLGEDGPRVIDFGIARTVDGGNTLTGGIVGTPSYMAPEQFEEGAIGPAADVFAWGCVICFAANGSSPFGGGSMAAITNRVLRAEPDLGALSGPLLDVVAACLAKDEATRPPIRDVLLWLLGRPDGARAPIGEALAAGSRSAASSAPIPPPDHTAAYLTGTVPGHRRTGARAAVLGAGAALVAIAVAAGIVLWPSTGKSGTPDHTTGPTPTLNGGAAGLLRTPRLGLEFWQNGAQDGMEFGTRGANEVVTATMRAAPFELRFPKQPAGVPVQVCAWTDDSVFSVENGASASTSPYFGPGTGIADYEYGSGTLYLNDEGHNHFVDTRIAAQSATEDKVYVAQTWFQQKTTPLAERKGDLYLTVFIDKNKDGKFEVTNPAEYEFVVLHF